MAEQSPLHEVERQAGAAFADDAGWEIPAHYGDPAAEYDHACRTAALFDRSHHAKLELTGPEAPQFLHNLCTNDVANLPLGAGCEAFLCDAKAKVLARVFVYHLRLDGTRDAVWLDADPGLNRKVLDHLDRHLIAEQVELADRTTEFAQMHLAGPKATAVLEHALADDVPDLEELEHMERTFGLHATAHVRRRDPLGWPGYDVVCLKSRAPEVWRLLTAAGAMPAGSEAYNVLRVEAGTPVYGADIDDKRFAMDVGRTALAISFNKGCYLGQEPIVMARDRAGHAPRSLVGLKLPGVVAAGSKLFRDGVEVGWVTSAVASPRLGSSVGLGYVRYGHQEPGVPLQVETASGPQPAEVAALPLVKSG